MNDGGKMYFLTYFKKYESRILSFAGMLCLGGASLFLENTVLSGVLSTLGLLWLFCGGRCAASRPDVILNGVLLWFGHVLRFSGLFGSEFLYTLYSALAFIPYCAVFIAALFFDRFLQKKGHPFLATFILPATYSLCDFLLAGLNFGFIVNFMSYLMCIPVIAVNLSFLGEYILTFVLLWILICFSASCFEPGKRMKAALFTVSILLSAVLLINGTLLRRQWKEADYTLKLALATSQEMSFTGESGICYTEEQQIAEFSSAMEQAKAEEAKLLLLNEEYFVWQEEKTEAMLNEVSQIVRSYGIPTLIGLEVVREDQLNINEAVYFDADGQILLTYVKNNLVPFIEAGDYVNGEETTAVLQTSIDGHSLNLAFIICFDINDEAYLNKIPSDTELLLVPSWDWDHGNLEQKRTAIRSARLGLTLVKHSFDGFSHVSCPNGDYIEEVDFRGQYETVQTVSVPIWEK